MLEVSAPAAPQLVPHASLKNARLIDEASFVKDDTETYERYWSKTFFQNQISENIYDTIASKSGAGNAARVEVSTTKVES